MTRKQAIAFPIVGTIRKGEPKRKNDKGNWVLGRELKDCFRVHFEPGTAFAEEKFSALLGKQISGKRVDYGPEYAESYGYLLPEIRAMVTSRSVYDAFTWQNAAYNAGQMFAVADDDRFIMLRDGKGGFRVKNGEPEIPFEAGMTVNYERNGRTFQLPMKTDCKMNLFIPEIGEMVQFVLKTTSYYDRLNLQQNLDSVQFFADTLNNGNAAGIPLIFFRQEREITWNKPGGEAQRVKKWLIFVRADPEWVQMKTRQLSQFALGGPSADVPLLGAGVDPMADFDADPDVITGDYGNMISAAEELGAVVVGETVGDDPDEELRKAGEVLSPKGAKLGTLKPAHWKALVDSTAQNVTDEMRQAARTLIKASGA